MTMRRAVGRLLLVGLASSLLGPNFALSASQVISCKTPDGRIIVAQAQSKECADSEQVYHGPTGETVKVVPKPLTPLQIDERDRIERARLAAEQARNEAALIDKQLKLRYHDKVEHDRARSRALQPAQDAVAASELRLAQLARERKPLEDDKEFYVGKPLPASLKNQIDANQTAVDAQRVLLRNQKLEIVRINANFDIELARLTQLWKGTPPGSLGPLPAAASAPPAT